MSKLGWYFETIEGWTTLLKDKKPYFDWDSRDSDAIPSVDQRAELLRLLNATGGDRPSRQGGRPLEMLGSARRRFGRH